jgi:hypothetical protein
MPSDAAATMQTPILAAVASLAAAASRSGRLKAPVAGPAEYKRAYHSHRLIVRPAWTRRAGPHSALDWHGIRCVGRRYRPKAFSRLATCHDLPEAKRAVARWRHAFVPAPGQFSGLGKSMEPERDIAQKHARKRETNGSFQSSEHSNSSCLTDADTLLSEWELATGQPVITRSALDQIKCGFNDPKLGQAIGSMIVFGDAA